MFDNFPKHDIDIIGSDGIVRARTKAIMDSKTATIPDVSILIEAGDEIRRTIPSGAEEAFEVVDPVYHSDFHGIPAHYSVKIKRKGSFPHGKGGNYNFYVSGPNARVNFQSHDQSTNVVLDRSKFTALKEAINEQIPDALERNSLSSMVEDMEQTIGNKDRYLQSYQKFIAAAANHITIVGPFIPAITEFLTHGS